LKLDFISFPWLVLAAGKSMPLTSCVDPAAQAIPDIEAGALRDISQRLTAQMDTLPELSGVS
jgi:hypothetical protein